MRNTFSGVKLDETGRRYVVHKPSGTIYYVREESERGKPNPYAPSAATIYSRHPNAAPAVKARKPKPAIVPRYARATFIEGSEPCRAAS
jgi:hypothetical protein